MDTFMTSNRESKSSSQNTIFIFIHRFFFVFGFFLLPFQLDYLIWPTFPLATTIVFKCILFCTTLQAWGTFLIVSRIETKPSKGKLITFQ